MKEQDALEKLEEAVSELETLYNATFRKAKFTINIDGLHVDVLSGHLNLPFCNLGGSTFGCYVSLGLLQDGNIKILCTDSAQALILECLYSKGDLKKVRVQEPEYDTFLKKVVQSKSKTGGDLND